MSGGITSKPWIRWTLVVIVVASLLALTVLPWYLWGKPEVEDTAQQKAQDVFDLARQSDLLLNVTDEAAFVDNLAQVYGEDGGYAVRVAESDLREAALLYTNVNTGEVLQRPTIAQAKYILYSLIVMKIYRPDLYEEKILPFIKNLKIQDDSKFPDWLKDDLAQLE